LVVNEVANLRQDIGVLTDVLHYPIKMLWGRMSKKDEIMDAAERALRKDGYSDFNLLKIANEVGIQKSSLYHHFASKSELVSSVFKRFSSQIFAFLDRTTQSEDRAGDRLLAYILESRELLNNGDSVCMSVVLNLNRGGLDSVIKNDLDLFHDTNIAWLKDTFELGLRDGSIANFSNPATEATASLSLIDGALLMAHAHQDLTLYDNSTALLRSRIRETVLS